MKKLNKFVYTGIILFLIFSIYAYLFHLKPLFKSASKASYHSAVLSLEVQLITALKEYYEKNKYYPNSLKELEIPWNMTDQATPEMLEDFIYSKQNNSYNLKLKPNVLEQFK